MKKFLIIIPTYNEKDNITNLLKEIINLKINNIDILVVDDNSPDGTAQVVTEFTQRNPSSRAKLTTGQSKETKKPSNDIYLLQRKHKKGLGKAYRAGFKWALARDYDYIISMDADLSHHPKYLPDIIKESENYDLVIGSRYTKGGKIEGWEWFRYINSLGANIFTKILLNLKPKDVTAGFKCYSRKLLQSLKLDDLVSSGYAFQVEMIDMAQSKGFTMTEIPIIFVDRRAGKSKIAGEFAKSVRAVFQLAMQKRTYRQMVKFAIVGAIGAFVDWTIYLFLTRIFYVYYLLARTLSFVFGVLNNYLWNKFWTFKDKDSEITMQFAKYLLASLVGLIINLSVMYIVVDILYLSDLYGLLAATMVAGLWNFAVNKLWVFNNKNQNYSYISKIRN